MSAFICGCGGAITRGFHGKDGKNNGNICNSIKRGIILGKQGLYKKGVFSGNSGHNRQHKKGVKW